MLVAWPAYVLSRYGAAKLRWRERGRAADQGWRHPGDRADRGYGAAAAAAVQPDRASVPSSPSRRRVLGPLRDPRDRSPAFADADIPHRVAVFADAYGMTARHRAELAPLAADMVRRYHKDSRASAELDPVFAKLWEDGAKVYLPRAEAWLREMAPAITARLVQSS